MLYATAVVGFRSVRRTSHGAWRCYASPPKQQVSANRPIPRAAVSVCVRCRDHYLLVQRGNSPNAGMWSFPGGKIEYAETTVDGGRRELAEETTGWPSPLSWHSRTFDTSDSFGEGYHYVIAHCYAELNLGMNEPLPAIAPADDAADAKWFPLTEIQTMDSKETATPGLASVIHRAEMLRNAGLLDTIKL